MAISIRQLLPNFHPEKEQVNDINFRNQPKIVEIFRFLKEENAVLKIKLPDTDKEFSSNIIDIDDKNLYFKLDEIFPEDGHNIFSRHGRLIAHAQVRGINVSFNTSLIQADKSGQFINYLCDIPDTISYIQRRIEYRVQIHATHLVQVTAQHQTTKQLLKGIVHDISLQGIGIMFKTHHIIKPGEQLIHCKLPLSNNNMVNFTLDVRHIQSKSPDTIHVGGNFKELDPRSSEIISKFVREMERMAIRR